MFTSFQDADKELFLSSLSARDIVNALTLNDVKNFLESLGVNQIVMNEEKEYLICPTICHNPIHEAESMKLYWYHNNKIFRCYTECNEAMSIFELYRRYMSINEYPIDLEEAETYVRQFVAHAVLINKPVKSKEIDLTAYKYDLNIPTQKIYNEHALDYGIKYYHPAWLRDGIKPEVMDDFNIRFSITQNKILIPHYNLNGQLIGIRGRAFNEDELEQGRKYSPVQIGNTLYTHPLQFNLYGINKHREGIERRRVAIIVEAEKSVLLDSGYYGELANTVACCGSTFNKYQINLLTSYLGVSEIVIALDKEYVDWRDEKAKKYRKKIQDACRKYMYQASFSYIWDYDNLLEEKDSPLDKGKEIFEYLYKNRVKVR
jgi:hypothetical protein